ncbi:hypothetical protein D9M71_618230 [compost metagenome]
MQQRLRRIEIVLVGAVGVFTEVVQRQADHFLRRIDDRDATVLEFAGVLRFEQQVQAVERHVRQALLHRFDIHPKPQRAPGIRHAIAVAGVDGGEFFQQVRVKVGIALQAFVRNGFQRTGSEPTGQNAG